MKKVFTQLSEASPSLESLALDMRVLQAEYDVVSEEKLSVHLINREGLSKLGGIVNNAMSIIGKKVKDVFKTSTLAQKEAALMLGFYNKLPKDISYSDLTSIAVPTPEGMRVTYLEYIQFIIDSQTHTKNLYDGFLNPFNTWLAACINDPRRLTSLAQDLALAPEWSVERFREELPKIQNGSSASQPYGKVIKRQNDWLTIDEKLVQMVNQERQQPKELVLAKVNDINENLNTLIGLINNPNSHHQPSKPVVKLISEFTFTLAENVTYYAIVESMVDSALHAIKGVQHDVLKQVDKMKK